MPFPLIPVAIGLLAGTAYAAQSRRQPKTLSPKAQAERAIVYETLINDVKDPEVLRRFSHAFREEGCIAEADMLMNRALLREQPPEVKRMRHEAYKKGMASKNSDAIRALADEFEKIGATGAAASLRDAALALERAKQDQTINEPSILGLNHDEGPNPRIEPAAEGTSP
jgi:hypothetical protein